MAHDGFLHLARPDLKPARLDEFLLAINNVEVAVLIHAGDVTGEEPCLAVFQLTQGIFGLGGHVVITLHYLRTVKHNFADFTLWQLRLAVVKADDFYLHVGQRHPNGTGLVLAFERIAVGGSGRFGETVALEDLAACQHFEFLFCFAHQRGGT